MHVSQLRRGYKWIALGLLSLLLSLPNMAQTLPSIRTGDEEVLFNQGLIDLQEQAYRNAENDFEMVLKSRPDDFEARYYLGLAKLDESAPAEAVSCFDQVLGANPDYTPARTARANALIELGRYQEAREDIDVLKRDPSSAANAMALEGEILYAQGNYSAAANDFSKARAGGADLGSTAVLQGLSYLWLGDLQRSHAAFQQANELQLDPSLLIASRQLAAATAPPINKPWQVHLSLGYEYDTNVALFDEGIALPSDISRHGDGRAVLEPSASYSLINNQKFDIGIATENYFAFQDDLNDFDLASYQVGAYANMQVNSWLIASLRYDFNNVELGHDPFLKRNVVTGELTYLEPQLGFTSLFTQFDRRQYDEQAGEGALNRDGAFYGIGLVQSFDLPNPVVTSQPAELQLVGRYRRENAKGQDFDGNLTNAGATVVVPLPWKLKADFAVNLDWELYDNGNSLDAEGDRRRDFETELSAGITRQINKNFAIRVDYDYTDHDSNIRTLGDAVEPNGINPYEFKRQIFGARMIFDF